MRVFKTLFWGAFFIFFSTAFLVQVNAAVSGGLQGVVIDIAKESNDDPIAHAVTDEAGKFEFKNLCGLEAGEYNIKFNLANVKNIDKESLKRMKFYLHLKIGKFNPEGKELIFYSTKVLIEGRNVCIDEKNVAFHFVLKNDIVLMRVTTKATGNKGGFAVGGFSVA